MASYQICGGNGGPIVDAYLASLGWKKIPDKQNFNWKLKWIEVNSQVNYGAFRDGEQLVNRIPNCSLLTNKLGLYNSLSEYSRVMGALKGDRLRLKLGDFVPETYRVDQIKDRDAFLEVYKDGEIWICKPTGLNQGKGIFLIRSREQIDKMLADREQRKQARRTKPLMPLIIQRYIEKPLLVDRKKFDIRAYMMIPSTIPFIVLYHKGYVRVTCEEYDLDSLDLSTHLTNQFVQKKVEGYKDLKEDTVWSMEKFNEYVNENLQEEKGLDTDWVLNQFERQIKSIMKFCFNSVKHKLQSRLGLFDIYGLDFMIDENMKIWLIEINVNPAMHVNCEVLKDNLPPILEGTIDLALECFEKTKKNQPLLPLQSQGTFQILFNACPKSTTSSTGNSHTSSHTQSSPSDSQTSPSSSTANSNTNGYAVPARRGSQSPIRSQSTRRSLSPSKEQSWGYISRAPTKSSKNEVGESQLRPLQNANNSSNSKLASVPVPVTGTNYIKNNIANLGSLANNRGRRTRLSRLDNKYTGIVMAEDSRDSGIVVGSEEADNSNEQKTLEVTEEPAVEDTAEDSNGTEGDVPYHKPLPNAAPVAPQQVSARARKPLTTERNNSNINIRSKSAASHSRSAVKHSAAGHRKSTIYRTGLENARTDPTRAKRLSTKNSIAASTIYRSIRRGHFSNTSQPVLHTAQAPPPAVVGEPTERPRDLPAGILGHLEWRGAVTLPREALHGPRGLRSGEGSQS